MVTKPYPKRSSAREQRRAALARLLDEGGITLIDEQTAGSLRDRLPAMGDRAFRDLLRFSGVPLAPVVEGVRQDDFQNLERTLLLLAQEYMQGDTARKKRVRALVIESKNHARFAAGNSTMSGEKRAEKEEMILWLMTWLENPAVFEMWVPLRKARLATADRSIPPL